MARKESGPSDAQSLDHPSHREQWLELARALGRLDARKDFEAIHGKPPKGTDDDFRHKIEIGRRRTNT